VAIAIDLSKGNQAGNYFVAEQIDIELDFGWRAGMVMFHYFLR